MSHLFLYAHQVQERRIKPFILRDLYQDYMTGRTTAETPAHMLSDCPPLNRGLYVRGALILDRTVEAIGDRGYPEGWAEWDGPFSLQQAIELDAAERPKLRRAPISRDPVVVGLSWSDTGASTRVGLLLLQMLGPGTWWPEH